MTHLAQSGQLTDDLRKYFETAYICLAEYIYFLKRYLEQMNQPARDEAVERQIAEYERRLRDQLFREHQLAELAAKQRESIKSRRFLPMVAGHEAAAGLGMGF